MNQALLKTGYNRCPHKISYSSGETGQTGRGVSSSADGKRICSWSSGKVVSYSQSRGKARPVRFTTDF